VFVLAHVGSERPTPRGGLLPTVAWRAGGPVEWAIDGGVFTAGALLDWLSRDLGLAPDTAALVGAAHEVQDGGGVRLLPALAGLGAPWWRPNARGVVAGLTAGVRAAHLARAALEAIAWRVADIVRAVSDEAAVEVEESVSDDEHPYGPGSHAAPEDGSQPDGFPIKGNADSMLYHVPGSSFYARTEAEVWFASAEAAEAAGFSAPPSQRKATASAADADAGSEEEDK
jgi:hypothetical protein